MSDLARPHWFSIAPLLLAMGVGSCATPPPSALQLEIQQQQTDIAAQVTESRRYREQIDRDTAAWLAKPTATELSAADCGPPPPAGWRAVLESALRAGLRDPSSGQFRFSDPERHGQRAGEGAPFKFLWKVYYQVNARNGFGGYTGFQGNAIYFKDGEWISIEEHMKRQREWRERRDKE